MAVTFQNIVMQYGGMYAEAEYVPETENADGYWKVRTYAEGEAAQSKWHPCHSHGRNDSMKVARYLFKRCTEW